MTIEEQNASVTFFPSLGECDVQELKAYVNIWLDGSQHDLSSEARQKRSLYIELLEAAEDMEVRQLSVTEGHVPLSLNCRML